MKILMLGWELPPHNSGGLGVACYQMCKHLSSLGVSIDFVLPYQADHQIDFMRIKSAIDIAPTELWRAGGAYDSACYSCETPGCQHVNPHDLRARQQHYTRYVEELVKTETPDAIHAHDWLTFEAGMRAKALTGKPLIAHVHATEFDRSGENAGNPLVHDIEYNGLMMADHIIAVSQVTKDIIVREYDIPSEKIEVVHNSVEVADFAGLELANSYVYLEEMKKRGYKVVVSLGRLTVQKGVRYLLQAAKLVHEKNPKVLFVIAGAGELRDELIELSADLGIAQNVLFTGFVRGKQWRDAYAVADMFVMSSVSEPFGLTALEAAGQGNAILISRQSGVGEVLQNVLKFDYWDTVRLANQIVAIAEQPALAELLATNVANEFNTFSWTKTAEKYKKLYERTLEGAVS